MVLFFWRKCVFVILEKKCVFYGFDAKKCILAFLAKIYLNVNINIYWNKSKFVICYLSRFFYIQMHQLNSSQ